MKSASIKSVKQLPAWFKLENYSKAKYFNAGEWYDELMPRFFMREGIEKFIINFLNLPQKWEMIKKDGLLFYSVQKGDKFRVVPLCSYIQARREIDQEPKRFEYEFSSIMSLTNLHTFGSYWLCGETMQKQVVQKMRAFLEESENEADVQVVKGDVADWLTKPFDDFPSDSALGLKNKFAYARIKLDASDEQIKKDFAVWLDYERKRRNSPAPKKNFNDVDFNSWYESATLPYLDLMYWASLENVKINQYVIAQAIFQDAYALGSDIDPLGKLKTTKKKAEYLMSYKTMKLLELQITD